MSSAKDSLKEDDSFKKRGRKRNLRVALTGVVTLAVRSTTIAANLISIPLTAGYLGTERFGLWLAMSTLLSWISFADMGLANSLTNAIATADGQNNVQQAKEAVSSAVWIMVAIAIIINVFFILAYPWINWVKVFNVTSNSIGLEAGQAVMIGFFFFALRLPLSIPGKIYTAYQEGYFYQLWAGLSGWLSLGALLVGIYFKVNLPVLVAAFFGTSLLADLLAAIHLFVWRRPNLKPSLQSFRWWKSWDLLKKGILFWIIQVAGIALHQTDLIIVAQLFGVSAVASYGVVLKLFSLISIVQTAFMMPLWPAYSEAAARKDVNWIVRTFRRSVIISLAWSVFCGIILFYLSPWIITSWVGKDATPGRELVFAMLITTVLNSLGQCIAFCMNGLGKINSQVVFGVMAGVTNLVLSVILGKLIGIAGVTWATGICFLLFSVIIIGIDALNQLNILKDKTNIYE